MKKPILLLPALTLALTLATAVTAQDRPREHVRMTTDDVAWNSCPASLPAGCHFAVIAGSPRQGPFVFRLMLPDGYEVPAHVHPTDANVTVITGAFNVGLGEEFDRSRTERVAAGGFVLFPAGQPHFVWADGRTIVQIHSDDAWGTTYVDPADDPRHR